MHDDNQRDLDGDPTDVNKAETITWKHADVNGKRKNTKRKALLSSILISTERSFTDGISVKIVPCLVIEAQQLCSVQLTEKIFILSEYLRIPREDARASECPRMINTRFIWADHR